MNKQSGNKVTNKAKSKDELNEQDLNKASGGVAAFDVIGGNAPLPSVDGLNDTHGVQAPNPVHKG